MKIIIIGGGKTVYFLCRSFASKGYKVVIINRQREECVQLSRQLNAVVLCGDGSDSTILQQAGAREANAVLAITPNDQDNLIICQLASHQFGVPRVIALANDPDNTVVFKQLGVITFSTTDIIGNLIEQRTLLEEVTNLLPVGEGRVNVTEIILPGHSPLAGKHLREIDLPENALIAVLIRDDQPVVPRGATILLGGDRIVLITLPENHGKVVKKFTGEEV